MINSRKIGDNKVHPFHVCNEQAVGRNGWESPNHYGQVGGARVKQSYCLLCTCWWWYFLFLFSWSSSRSSDVRKFCSFSSLQAHTMASLPSVSAIKIVCQTGVHINLAYQYTLDTLVHTYNFFDHSNIDYLNTKCKQKCIFDHSSFVLQ